MISPNRISCWARWIRRMGLVAALVCTGLAPAAEARGQTPDTLPTRPSGAAEVAGGILGSAAGALVGAVAGLDAESRRGCANDICGGGALVGAALGGTFGAAGGAYLGGRMVGQDISFPRALGGAALGLVIFGGLTAVAASADADLALPLVITIPLGQGLFAAGAGRRRPE